MTNNEYDNADLDIEVFYPKTSVKTQTKAPATPEIDSDDYYSNNKPHRVVITGKIIDNDNKR